KWSSSGRLLRPVTMRTSSRPAATASSTTYWIAGLSTTGSIPLGVAFVAGRNRVPRPAAGMTALLIRGCDVDMAATISAAFAGNLHLRLLPAHMNILEQDRDKLEIQPPRQRPCQTHPSAGTPRGEKRIDGR